MRVRCMARACDVIAARLSDRPLAEVSDELQQRAGTPTEPRYIGAAGPYADSCIHLRGLALPQGLDVTVPPERWERAIHIITSPRGQESFLPASDFLDGLAWRATDRDRVWGAGPLVEGTTEALAMTMSGRTAYLDQLRGDGADQVMNRGARPVLEA